MFEDLLLQKESILQEMENAEPVEYRQLEKRLYSINEIFGEEEQEIIAKDELVDQWEREIAEGKTPNFEV